MLDLKPDNHNSETLTDVDFGRRAWNRVDAKRAPEEEVRAVAVRHVGNAGVVAAVSLLTGKKADERCFYFDFANGNSVKDSGGGNHNGTRDGRVRVCSIL